jgi:DNA-binding CsgD family transcriptional regulator/tetratricopeptide (TPR) repeat protein
MTIAEPTPLVGREAELAELCGLLDRSSPGAPGAALVSGEAGIGKTRLLREFGRAAAARGALVLVGHCVNFGGDAVPFLPISEAFGRLGRDEPETVDRLHARYPLLARLLPQRRRAGVEGEESRLSPADLYEALLGALLELASERTVVLVVEDLHWADGATRDLFGFLLARLGGEGDGARLLPVGSYRSDDLHRRHPLRSAVLEWGRLPGVLRLALEPLERSAVATLLRRLDAQLDNDAVADVLERAQGNAFFAEQLVAEMSRSRTSAAGIPRDLADLLLLRLERLSPESRRVLQVIAVAGQRIEHELLARVAGLEDALLDAALREATEAHVLDRTTTDGYTFRHALLAEAVYDDLLPGERRRHHALFARVIASQELAAPDADLARHAREAGDLSTAFDASIRAGKEAMRVAAPGEAMRHYEVAQELAAQVTDPRTVSVLPCKAANAASHAGHPFRAIHLLQEALQRLPDDAEPVVRAELLIELAKHAAPLDAGLDLVDISRQALDLLPEEPPTALRARALASVARALGGNPLRAEEAIAYTEQAQAVAAQVHSTHTEVEAAATRARLEKWRVDPQRAESLLAESVERARAAGELATEMRSLYSLAGFRYEAGRLEDARRTYTEGLTLARERGRPWAPYGTDARAMLVQLNYVIGDWDEALRLAQPDATAPALARAGLSAAALGVAVGRGTENVVRLGEESRAWWYRDGMIAVLACTALMDAHGQSGDPEAALAVHDDVVRKLGELWLDPWFDGRIRMHALALGALAGSVARENNEGRVAAVERGRELVGGVRKVVEKAIARRGRLGPESAAWSARAEAEWARLRWAAGVEAPAAEELVTAWRGAVAGFGYGHRFEQARSRARLAAALHAHGDAAEASCEAESARAAARELQAAPLLAELAAFVPSRAPAAERRDHELTPREQQVLGLLALGRTNRQIGKALFITDKTVSVHVSNLMAKLGASGRTEAAALARRAGLLPDEQVTSN